MKFELTPAQLETQQIVRDFANRVLAPGVADRDERGFFSRELFDAMATAGLTGICFPEECGGSGKDALSYVLAVEELSRIDAGVAVTLSTSVSLCSWPIFAYGTVEQRCKYLTPLARGSLLGAFCLTEPNAGTDAAALMTIAKRRQDHYVMNGKKIFVTNGGEADVYVVFAVTDADRKDREITAFIVEKGMSGVRFGNTMGKMGIRSSVTREVIFDNAIIPSDNVLGTVGQGFKIAMAALNGGRIAVAAQAVGIAQAAVDHSIHYSKNRIQFGKSVSKNQAIAFMLADMVTKTDSARLLTYRAAGLRDAARPHSKEAAMAKLCASDAAMSVTTDAVQILGGNGYSRKYPVERLMRDAKITQIYEGTNQVQRMIIAGAILSTL